MVYCLGRSAASLSWWHRTILAADPVLDWSADQRTAIVHQGQTLLDFTARCYLVTPRAWAVKPDAMDEELLAQLPRVGCPFSVDFSPPPRTPLFSLC